MIRTTCPEDHELLPLAAGEPADGEVSDHVRRCPACRERVDRMTAEVRSLRRTQAALPTEPWPEPSAPGGPPEGTGSGVPGGTEDWTPAGSASTPAPPTTWHAGAGAPPPAIGQYLVVGELDRGGQAVVYRVVHAGLGRDL